MDPRWALGPTHGRRVPSDAQQVLAVGRRIQRKRETRTDLASTPALTGNESVRADRQRHRLRPDMDWLRWVAFAPCRGNLNANPHGLGELGVNPAGLIEAQGRPVRTGQSTHRRHDQNGRSQRSKCQRTGRIQGMENHHCASLTDVSNPTRVAATRGWDSVQRVLCSIEFIEAKVRAGQTLALQQDYELACDALPELVAQRDSERARHERMERYVRELAEYARGERSELDAPLFRALRLVPPKLQLTASGAQGVAGTQWLRHVRESERKRRARGQR